MSGLHSDSASFLKGQTLFKWCEETWALRIKIDLAKYWAVIYYYYPLSAVMLGNLKEKTIHGCTEKCSDVK